jgi:dihydroorotate dehydrogenase
MAENLLNFTNNLPLLAKQIRKKNNLDNIKLKQTLFKNELVFKNPVGLGAGFDKNGTLIDSINLFGFGFSEIGTVTPKPQDGNPKPRLFRHKKEESLQNAMGFNNDGYKKLAEKIENHYPFDIPIGVNIGKNKVTSSEEALNDYILLVEKLHSKASYIVINLSSPNTPNLRDLQNTDFLADFFRETKNITSKPILVKISPDMELDYTKKLVRFAVDNGASGIIATNTTIDYSLVKNPYSIGGISGSVLREKSFKVLQEVTSELKNEILNRQIVIISVGGIDSADEVYRRLKAGASLVQIYTALIYHGPFMISRINNQLLELMQKDGFNSIDEVIGFDLK